MMMKGNGSPGRPGWWIGWLAFPLLAGAVEPESLELGPSAGIEKERVEGGGWQLTTVGTNPHFWTSEIPADVSLETHPILSFDYFSTEDIPRIRVRVPTGESGATQMEGGAAPFSEAWRNFGIDLRLANQPFTGGPKQRFAIVLGTKPGHAFQLKNLRLRAANPAEEQSAEKRRQVRTKRGADGDRYLDYLETDFPSAIESIEIGEAAITLRGRHRRGDFEQFGVAEVRPFRPSHHALRDSRVLEGSQEWREGSFEVTLPRFENQRDRATSRWRVIGVPETGSPEALSPDRYPDAFTAGIQRDLSRKQAGSIKGLGGIPALTPDHEIFDLGIHHATVNVVLNAVLSEDRRPGSQPWRFEGREYFINRGLLGKIDRNVTLLNERDIVVSVILLVGNRWDDEGRRRDRMIHPEALPGGKFAMPNLAGIEGAETYRAVIHLLAERYTRESEEFGRVSNWIMHNEVDQSGTWTTMGEQPLARYVETYLRSARLVHHSVRRFDPHARVFVSLTHHWTKQSGGAQTFIVRDLIDLFARAARREGDFEWGMAYHPYPLSLREPRTWEDEVSFDFDTKYITPRNIEVLARYLEGERFLFEGRPRGVLLSEQGINALSLSPRDQEIQAAGIVYTMQRVRRVPIIEAFHYHAYRDAPEAEGGLLLGLTNREQGRKRAWEVYRAIGTEREDAVSRFAWPLIGVSGPEDLFPDTEPGSLQKD